MIYYNYYYYLYFDRCPDESRMSSSEEEYGRTERPLPKPSLSAHSHAKNKYSETSGRGVSESSGVSNRYLDFTAEGRLGFQENTSASLRYNETGNGSQAVFSHGCENGRYSASNSRSSSPRYSDQTNTRYSEPPETIIRYPTDNRGESGRGSRYGESSGNSYIENPGKSNRYSEGRMPNGEGDIYPTETGGKYSSSSNERFIISPSSEPNMEKYGKNDHYLHGEKAEISVSERNGRSVGGNSNRSTDRYYTDRIPDRSERNHERLEKQHNDRVPEKYLPSSDRYITHIAQESSCTKGSDRYFTSERNSDRYGGTSERNSERYNDEYLQSADRISNSDQFVGNSDAYRSNERGEGYRSDRFLCSSNLEDVQRFDRYCTLPSHSDKYNRKTATERFENSRYLPPPAPAPSERYHPPERYIPPPAPSNDRFNESIRERFMETPSKDRYSDRYIPPPAPERFIPTSFERFHTTPINPGDPYMRRDLGYHHHYRLPHPNYHLHHQQSAYYHSHYQRTLPHRSLGSYHHHHHHHSILPSPSRTQLRCCPSPNPYVQPEDLNTGNSNSSHSANVLTANITGPSMPVLAASLTNGQSLKSFSASVNVNIVAAQGTNTSSREREREYMPPSPSPLLTNRGRPPPSGNASRMPSSSHVENAISNIGRHASTPTPPPPSLPRCSSMSNCELNGDNTMCKVDHSHHHYTPARRSCSGALEPGTSLTLCCSSSKRSGGNTSALNLSNAISTNQSTSGLNHSLGTFSDNIPKVPSIGALSTSTGGENGRQGVSVSCVVTTNSHTHSTIW